MTSLLDEHRVWEAIVVGAGPAGSTIANLLARSGRSVLLIDKSHFPRAKVCGCCLSGHAVETLQRLNLAECLHDSMPVEEFHLGYQRQRCSLFTQGGRTISRISLDERLVNLATAAGADVLCGWTATIGPIRTDYREVSIQCDSQQALLKAKIVCSCGGLNQKLKGDDSTSKVEVSSRSKIGVATTINGDEQYPSGIITMATGRAGYVGIVKLENGQLDLAAALRQQQIKQYGSISAVVNKLITEGGFPVPKHFDSADWRGTVPLTRRRRAVSGERLFVLGDAAGYVEPFTGEGMYWAFHGAESLFPVANAAIESWQASYAEKWSAVYRTSVLNQQLTCRVLKRIMNSPWTLRFVIPALRRFPQSAKPFLRAIHGRPNSFTKVSSS